MQSSLELLDLFFTLLLSFKQVLFLVFNQLLRLLQLLLKLLVLALQMQIVLLVLGDGLTQLCVLLSHFLEGVLGLVQVQLHRLQNYVLQMVKLLAFRSEVTLHLPQIRFELQVVVKLVRALRVGLQLALSSRQIILQLLDLRL